jgi:hypothetical protein
LAYGEVKSGEGAWGRTTGRVDEDPFVRFEANQHISDYTAEHSLAGNRRVVTGVITLEDVIEVGLDRLT